MLSAGGVPSGRRRPRQILASPVLEILVLRPVEIPRGQQFLVFIEEPDRHVCGQGQR